MLFISVFKSLPNFLGSAKIGKTFVSRFNRNLNDKPTKRDEKMGKVLS